MIHPISKVEVVPISRSFTPNNASDTEIDRRSQVSRFGSNQAVGRPKSSPIHIAWLGEHKIETNAFNTTQTASAENLESEKYRPHTTGCDRISQLFHEPVRRHNFKSTLSQRRARSAVVAQRKAMESPREFFEIGPGYIMYKTPTKIAVQLNSEEIFPGVTKVERAKSAKSSRESVRDSFNEHLQSQITDLQLFLEEEKLAHKETAARLAEELKDTTERLNEQRLEEIKTLTEKYEDKISNLKEEHSNILEDEISRCKEIEKKMNQDIDFLQASFESYKTTVTIEMQDRWKQREMEMAVTNEKILGDRLQELSTALTKEKDEEILKLNQDFQKEVEKMQREHRREIEQVKRMFSESQLVMDELQNKNQQLASAQSDIECLQETNESLKNQLKLKREEAEIANRRVQEFEQSFESRVQQVDDNYRSKIEGLKLENLDIRRAYLRKCEELVEQKKENDRQVMGKLENAKDAMQTVINTRNRIASSLAGLNEDEDAMEKLPYNRRLSEPITDEERIDAIKSAGQSRTQVNSL